MCIYINESFINLFLVLFDLKYVKKNNKLIIIFFLDLSFSLLTSLLRYREGKMAKNALAGSKLPRIEEFFYFFYLFITISIGIYAIIIDSSSIRILSF